MPALVTLVPHRLVKQMDMHDPHALVTTLLNAGAYTLRECVGGGTAAAGQLILVADGSQVTLPASSSNGDTVIVVNSSTAETPVAPATGEAFTSMAADAKISVPPRRTKVCKWSSGGSAWLVTS